jgi:hypothetical protein
VKGLGSEKAADDAETTKQAIPTLQPLFRHPGTDGGMRLRRYVRNTSYWLGLVLPSSGIVIDPAKPPTSQTWLTQFGHGSLREGICTGNRLPD